MQTGKPFSLTRGGLAHLNNLNNCCCTICRSDEEAELVRKFLPVLKILCPGRDELATYAVRLGVEHKSVRKPMLMQAVALAAARQPSSDLASTLRNSI